MTDVEDRARKSLGTSSDAVYRMVAGLLADLDILGGELLDVGCGVGLLWPFIQDRFDRYSGADVLVFEGFPKDQAFHKLDLDTGRVPLPDGSAEVVAAVETIEHLENPRALFRELTRLAKPGGWVVVTTPNQLSLTSKLSFCLLNEFSWFRGGNYPAHITALIEIDLRRMASECGLIEPRVVYSRYGRIAGTPWHYPRWLSRILPRSLSDNIAIAARKPA
jgi:SAM-dependent methyltransferase